MGVCSCSLPFTGCPLYPVQGKTLFPPNMLAEPELMNYQHVIQTQRANVLSLSQAEPYVHAKLAVKLAAVQLLWPIKGQIVDHSQAKHGMHHSGHSDRLTTQAVDLGMINRREMKIYPTSRLMSLTAVYSSHVCLSL